MEFDEQLYLKYVGEVLYGKHTVFGGECWFESSGLYQYQHFFNPFSGRLYNNRKMDML